MSKWQPTTRQCIRCSSHEVQIREVEDDFGHEDEQFRCSACGASWWIDGIDS